MSYQSNEEINRRHVEGMKMGGDFVDLDLPVIEIPTKVQPQSERKPYVVPDKGITFVEAKLIEPNITGYQLSKNISYANTMNMYATQMKSFRHCINPVTAGIARTDKELLLALKVVKHSGKVFIEHEVQWLEKQIERLTGLVQP